MFRHPGLAVTSFCRRIDIDCGVHEGARPVLIGDVHGSPGPYEAIDRHTVAARQRILPIKIATRHVEARAEAAEKAPGGIELGPNQKLIESPMVGTFYRAPSTDSQPFVEEGGSVRKGQPLCIIEAMKMMNEIESPASGRVVRIIAENGTPVEYGQPLMILEVA
jgi:acetyl-CoA carboxylase biotin carboxyl carrier protein